MPVLETTDNPLLSAEMTGFHLDSERRFGSVCRFPRPTYTTAFGECGLNLCDV